MNSKSIEIMKQTKRLELSRWQTFTHYLIVLFILFIPTLTLVSLFEIYVTNTYKGKMSASELILGDWYWFVPAIVFYFIQKRRLKFIEVNVEYTNEEFQEAIERTQKQFNWTIELNNKKVFRAYRPWDWTASWGEMITIIKGKNQILINSICDPNIQSSVVSFGWNKKNIDSFLKNLTEVKEGVQFQVKTTKIENEFTLKKMLKRIFMYLVCLTLLTLCLFAIFTTGSWKSIGIGIVICLLVSTYVYADLKILLKK